MKLISRLKPVYNFKEILAAMAFSTGNILRFEKAFAKKFECDYGVMFSYGRAGLYSLFKIWNLKNDEIICPAYTCVVVAHAIVLSGNTPVFIDCEKDSFNMSLEGIRNAITVKTRAIIVTHLFGYPMDVVAVQKIIKEAEEKYNHKIYMVQDCAHSFGCRWNGELVTKFGDAAIYGLNISKIINSIFGGMVTTNSQETYHALMEYRKTTFRKSTWLKSIKRFFYLIAIYPAFNAYIYGFVNWLEGKGLLDRFVKYYDDASIDFPKDWNTLPTEIEARIGLVQLNKYDKIIQLKGENSNQWQRRFKQDNGISFLLMDNGATYSHCVGLVTDRGKWIEKFRQKNINLGVIVDYVIPYTQAYEKYKFQDYPISRYYSEHVVNFPNYKNFLY
ncbi:MAG: hypothetical protein A2X77_04770 [Gammaproteobacteria bacterium GWE2_42_36]|nr:MAG: hypothetical protein A2X77_04770 [Gammaproteobacteria bacterium GWE2_42_36]